MTASCPPHRSRWAGPQPAPTMPKEDVAGIIATVWPDRESAWAAAREVADAGWWVQAAPVDDARGRIATVRYPKHGGPLGDIRFAPGPHRP